MKKLDEGVYQRAAKIAHWAKKRDKKLFMRLPHPSEQWTYGVGGLCALCRNPQKGVHSYSHDRLRCISCAKRDNLPKWVNVYGFAIRRWRGIVHQDSFAEAAGFSRQRLSIIENTDRISGKVAQRIALALVRMASRGTDLGAVAQEWPLFHLLVPEHMLQETFLQDGDQES